MKDSSVLQKENSPENILFRIDGGKLSKTADGKIIMGSKPNILTWLGIAFFGVLTLGILVLMLNEILQGSFANLMGGIFAAILFGYITFSMYKRSQVGQITIDPVSQKIESLKRQIGFDDIEGVIARRTLLQPGSRRSATIIAFQVLVTNEAPMFLGSVSGDKKKTEEKAEQIISLLQEIGFAVTKV